MPATQTRPLVLIVEDQPDLRDMTSDIVETFGFRVLTAENGREALAFLEEAATLPDLMLLDLMMPVMTGWQLLEELQKNNRLSKIPVALMSAITEDFPLPNNVVARLTKPALFDDLAAVLALARDEICLPEEAMGLSTRLCQVNNPTENA